MSHKVKLFSLPTTNGKFCRNFFRFLNILKTLIWARDTKCDRIILFQMIMVEMFSNDGRIDFGDFQNRYMKAKFENVSIGIITGIFFPCMAKHTTAMSILRSKLKKLLFYFFLYSSHSISTRDFLSRRDLAAWRFMKSHLRFH